MVKLQINNLLHIYDIEETKFRKNKKKKINQKANEELNQKKKIYEVEDEEKNEKKVIEEKKRIYLLQMSLKYHEIQSFENKNYWAIFKESFILEIIKDEDLYYDLMKIILLK